MGWFLGVCVIDEVVYVFEGGCYCGVVWLWVIVCVLEVFDCNCLICFKKGFLYLIVLWEDFTLLIDEVVFVEYWFGIWMVCYLFCRCCGVYFFYILCSYFDCVDVNVCCLELFVFDCFMVVFFDGLWWEESVDIIC